MTARKIHRILGLWPGTLLLVLGLTGAMLAFFPIRDAWMAPSYGSGTTVAGLVQHAQSSIAGLETLKRQPSGSIIAYSFDATGPHAQRLDPDTGEVLGPYQASGAERWLRDLHRSLFLGDAGRLITAFVALSLLVLSVSGAILLARQLGGWRHVFGMVRGTPVHRLHAWTGRILLLGLSLSCVTALWMSATTFGLLSVDAPPLPAVQSAHAQGPDIPAAHIPFLQALPVSQLRALTLPAAGVAGDVWSVRTSQGETAIDRKTGAQLAWAADGAPQRLNNWIYTLHTGQGWWGWALILALLGLSLPLFWISGLLVRTQHRGQVPVLAANAVASQADMLIFVASETGSTWGFAQALHDALVQRGHKVHAASLAAFDVPAAARHVFVLAATYGDGKAPAPAAHALDRIRVLPVGRASITVLGFGDRQFPRFCAYARALDEILRARGWRSLLPFEAIHQQNVQAFEHWGRMVSDVLDEALDLRYVARVPATRLLTVLERTDYSDEVTGAVAILRLGWPTTRLWDRLRARGMPRFQAGDLLGVVPDTVQVPRYYSLASGRADGFVEICVRKVPDGLCSTYLHSLRPGDVLRAFVKQNTGFTLAAETRPVILIGAGTGIAPLAGFIRGNFQHVPMFLYFGARDPDKDFLFDSALQRWISKGHLTGLKTAFSRVAGGGYVQDALRRDAGRLQDLVSQGAVRDFREAHAALALDMSAGRACKVHPLVLDLCGIAKGYGVDKMTAVMRQHGVPRALLSLDGELRALAGHAEGRPWAVALERPQADIRAAHGVIALENRAVATSGDYRHRIQLKPGLWVSHTIDGRVRQPLNHAVASVTVLAQDCMRADAWASALLVLGPTEGPIMAQRMGLDALFLMRRASGWLEWGTGCFGVRAA